MSARRRESAEPFVSESTADINRSADSVLTSFGLRLTGTHGFGLRWRAAFDEEVSHGGTERNIAPSVRTRAARNG